MKKLVLFLIVMILALLGCQSKQSQPVVATPTLAFTPGPEMKPDIDINFNDLPEGSCQTESYDFGDFYCKDNEYHLVAKGSGSIATTNDGDFKNFILQAQMRLSGEKGAYGVVFRGTNKQGNTAFYIFEIHPDGQFRLSYWSTMSDKTLIPWTESAAIKKGEAINILEVIAQDSRLTLFINSQQLASFVDNALKTGSAGPVALEEGHAVVSTIKVWELP
jgi:hypothetical protein